MRIHNHSAGDSVRGAKHDVSCFSRNTGQRENLLHRARHLSAKLFNDRFAGSHYGLGFVPEKSRWTAVLFQLTWRGITDHLPIRILLFKLYTNPITPHLIAL